jgi:O-antigen/teichoic acid export membrane protein
MKLSQRTFSGFVWSIGQLSSVYVLNFITLIILSWYLSPAIFGTIAIVQIFIAIGNVLSDSGMSSSLIRSSNLEERDYSCVFIINVVAGSFIYVSLFFIAPYIALYFDDEQLTVIVRILGLSCLMQALSAVFVARLTKEMNFRRQFMLQMPASLVSSSIGILLAVSGWGVWSLVWLNVSRTLVFMLLCWLFVKIKLHYSFNADIFRKHFSFGSRITAVGIINAIYSNAYNFVIGKNFNTSTVGLFHQANTLSLLPVDILSTALDKVTYPTFASIQNESERLQNVYKKVIQQAVFWSCPLMLFLILNAEGIFSILFNEQWLGAVPYFEILCIYALLHPLQVYNLNILKVKGRADLLLRIELIKKFVGIVGVIAAIQLGIVALLWFKVLYGVFIYYMNTFYSGKLLGYGAMKQLRDILPLFILGFCVFLLTWSIDYFFSLTQLSDWGLLTVNLVIFGSAYLLTAAAIKIEPLRDFKELVMGFLSSKKF